MAGSPTGAIPANFLQLFVGGSALNYTFWQDDHFDRLMASAEQSAGEPRLELLRQAEIRLLEQQVIVPLYYYVSRHLIKPDVKGFENNLMDISPVALAESGMKCLVNLAWLTAISTLVACGSASDPDNLDQPVPLLPQPVDFEPAGDGRPPAEALADSQVLYRGNGEEPQTLDPHLAEGVPTSTILRDLFEGLDHDRTGLAGSCPGTAAHWDISR